MVSNKLIQKQIRRYLLNHHLEDPNIVQFIHAVNDSYVAYERDKEIVNHAFLESEKEYHNINESLKKEYEAKKQSIANLYNSLDVIDDDYEDLKENDRSDDLVYISKYLNRQIEKRRQTEQDLLTTIELLKTLLANLHSGVLVEDEFRNILFTNQMFCDIFQLPTSPESMIGFNCANSAESSKHLFVNPEQFTTEIQTIIAQRKPIINQQLQVVNGRYLERDYIPIFIKEEDKGHLWKYTDITSRIENKNLLMQSEERNRLIMNAALNAIITIDGKGYITFWNNQAETLFGWKREEVVGKPLTETIIPAMHHQGHQMGMERYMRTGVGKVLNQQLEMEALRSDGTLFPIEISITPIYQNDELFFCSFIQDISKRKKAEKKLRLQEEKYRNIIANMNLGMLEVDNDNCIQFANQSFLKISGYELDDLLGKNPEELFVSGENLQLIESKRKLRTQGVSDIYQLPIKNKRGELRWWAISGAPNYDDKGNLKGSIGIHLDITEQKELEIELENEKSKAIQASKAKESFLANMSHEIRTPLNAIIGFLRELEKEPLPEKQRVYLENSTIASKHLLSIINNILDISKIESGEMSLVNSDFELEKSIENVISILQPRAIQKGLELRMNFDPLIAKALKGDTLRIEQILFNLLGNALKFTFQGSIWVNCRLQKAHSDSQEICITVMDSGIGMEADFLQTIFNKFSQEENETAQKVGGTGLGMTITKELIELMQGSISIESERNKGTTVKIYLNLQLGSLKNIVVETNKSKVIDLQGIRVLLVEDNEFNRMVAQNTLKTTNCIVTEAENGAEAVALVRNHSFDLILMDIQMPVMDGITATTRIRTNLQCTTPIIAFTANAFKSEIEKCKQAGMNDYITKPFEEKLLLEKMMQHLDANRKEKENTVGTRSYNLSKLYSLSRGNEEFIQKMIEIFNTQCTHVMEAIEKAIAAENFLEVSRLIHKIKPSIDEMGIQSIYHEVRELEEISKNTTDLERIQFLFEIIQKQLKLSILELKTHELTNK